jgi:CheY-like chemotaxis protein
MGHQLMKTHSFPRQTSRVLIVDDHPEIRMLLRTRLEMAEGIEVVGEASNGKESLALVAALAPAAVVLDLDMPVMRGDEAIPLMRDLAPRMRILLFTGSDEHRSIRDEWLPDAIVTKGQPLDGLITKLRELLAVVPDDPAIPATALVGHKVERILMEIGSDSSVISDFTPPAHSPQLGQQTGAEDLGCVSGG